MGYKLAFEKALKGLKCIMSVHVLSQTRTRHLCVLQGGLDDVSTCPDMSGHVWTRQLCVPSERCR
jgi:hypothetical protein